MAPRKPLVLVVTSTLPRWAGDSEPRFVLDLCDALSDRYRIMVLAPHCRGAALTERFGDVEVRRFRYFPEGGEVLAYEGGILPKLRRNPWLWLLVPPFMAALVLSVAQILCREPVALVHAHWLLPQGLAVRIAGGLARRSAPLICTAHGADVFGLRGGLARVLQRWVASGCARIGVVSEPLGDELVRRGVDRGKIRQLPMGVTVPAAVPQHDARDPNLIAFAGRIVEKKGVSVLLDAFTELSVQRPQTRLRIAGGGPDLARYREPAAARGLSSHVEFLGAVPQSSIQQLFGEAAVAVMPSVTARDGDAEGLGLVMLEAMAAGCPVIVTDLPVVRGVIRPGDNGLVFPERDSAALVDALRRLLDDRELAARLGNQGRKDVQTCFSWPAVAEQHHRVYQEAVGSPGNT